MPEQLRSEYTPVDTRYIPFVQQPYCCLPATLQTILYKNSLPLYSQEEIGGLLGLVVAPEDAKYFWNVETADTPPPAGYGTRINTDQYSLSRLIETLGLPFQLTNRSASSLRDEADLLQQLKDVEAADQDALACFKASIVYNNSYSGGHICAFDRVINGNIRLINPEAKNSKWQEVEPSLLLEAIKAHGDDNSGGIWIFRRV